jgi:hypothetical protein
MTAMDEPMSTADSMASAMEPTPQPALSGTPPVKDVCAESQARPPEPVCRPAAYALLLNLTEKMTCGEREH